jgi:hypothetical protein
MTLSYSAAFLGRKNPKKDPVLVGRADYICGVVAVGRWVVEVKAPDEELNEAVVQQAHTYAAHPEVAAFYFLVTNGRSFRLFETGRLSQPLLEWSLSDQDTNFLRILNLLGPEALRRRARLILADPGDPLGEGLSSKVRVISGTVYYDSLDAGQLSNMMASLVGLELPVTSGEVSRDPDGRIHARVSVASVSPLTRPALGPGDHYDFYSSSRYISTDERKPTIFQNFFDTIVAEGTPVSIPGMQSAMPFGMRHSAFTEVVGFVCGDQFDGTMKIEVELQVGQINPLLRGIFQNQFGITPGPHRIAQSGRFCAQLASGI